MTRHPRRSHPNRRLVTPQEFKDRGLIWFFLGLLTLVVVGVLWLAMPTGGWVIVAVLFTIAGLGKVAWGVHMWRLGR